MLEPAVDRASTVFHVELTDNAHEEDWSYANAAHNIVRTLVAKSSTTTGSDVKRLAVSDVE